MSTETKRTHPARDTERRVYRLTGAQVLRMLECGILPDKGAIELWDGVLYEMTKGETHYVVVKAITRALESLIPGGFHVRQEAAFRHGNHSLPEPDVAVVPGDLFDYDPNPPPLSQLRLVVEVSQSSSRADTGARLRRYAGVGIPVYWIADVPKRTVTVHTLPRGTGKRALYSRVETYLTDQAIPVVIDGREVGRVNVDDLFPPEKKG